LAGNGFGQNPLQLRDIWDHGVFRQEIKSSGLRSGFWVSIAVGDRRFNSVSRPMSCCHLNFHRQIVGDGVYCGPVTIAHRSTEQLH